MDAVAAAVPPLLAAVLVWSGVLKLVGSAGQVAGTALHRLLARREQTGRHTVAVYRTVGVIELAVAAALLAVPGPAAPVAATVLALGFLGYLWYAAVAAPTSSCGCMGGRAPVSWRSFARAGAMVILALLAAVAGTGGWWSVPRPATAGAFAGALAGGGALIVAFSVELDRFWLLPLRRLRVRLPHPLGQARIGIPLQATVDQLQRSEAYRRVAPLLTSDILEHWDAERWRIVTYAARYQDRQLTAVFAVPFPGAGTGGGGTGGGGSGGGGTGGAGSGGGGTADPEVRVSLVDESTGEVSTVDGPLLPAAR
ncbi:MAG: hypothetical protein J2P15_02005 [Micromonosporaceae bacterium]|nr:hypothetical protein [Micromonosporaceae bacterium]